MTTLDLCLLQLQAEDHDRLGRFTEWKKWVEFETLSKDVARRMARKFDSVFLYHGTRLPDGDLVRNHGLKFMSSRNLAELVAPLWERSVVQIEAELNATLRFSKFYKRSICLEPDRRVMFNEATNSFVRGGSEALRDIACHGEAQLLLTWKPYVVIVKMPRNQIEDGYLEKIIRERISFLFATGDPGPVTYCCNLYSDLPKEFVYDVIEYDEFKKAQCTTTTSDP